MYTRLAADTRRRDQDGPPRGRRAQPAHRQGVRRAHEQQQPRRRQRAGRRGEPDHGQPLRPRHRADRDVGPGGDDLRLEHPAALRRPRRSTAHTYFAGFPKELVSPISCPDNVAFDSEGNLWISTDGAPGTIGYNDGLFKVPLEGDRARPRAAVPLGAARGRDLRSGHPRPGGHGLRRRAAPGRGRRGRRADARSSPTTCRRTAAARSAAPRPSVVQVFRA